MLVLPNAFAGSAGTGIYNFLKVNPGARGAAVGSANTFITPQSFYVNPAVLPWIGTKQLSIEQLSYLADSNYSLATYTQPLDKFRTLGFSLGYLGVGGLTKTVIDTSRDGYSEQGSFKYMDALASVGYGDRISTYFSYGVSLKAVQESIDDKTSSGVMLSAGGLFTSYRKDLRWGFGFVNLGPQVKGYNLPTGAYLGFSNIINNSLEWTGEAVTYTDQITDINTGFEYNIKKAVFLRGGYRHPLKDNDLGGQTANSFSGGLGIIFRNLEFDYAWVPYGDLGNTHRLAVTIKFETSPQGREENSGAVGESAVLKQKIANTYAIDKSKNIAVAEFSGKNVPQSDASIVADFLRKELVNTNRVAVVEKANMDKILAESAFQQSGCSTSECAVQMGKVLNVKNMILGTLSKLGSVYYVVVSNVDVESGKIIAAYSGQTSSINKLDSVCKAMAVKIVE